MKKQNDKTYTMLAGRDARVEREMKSQREQRRYTLLAGRDRRVSAEMAALRDAEPVYLLLSGRDRRVSEQPALSKEVPSPATMTRIAAEEAAVPSRKRSDARRNGRSLLGFFANRENQQA